MAASDKRRKTHSSCPLGKHHPVPFPFNGTKRLLFIWWTEGETEKMVHISVRTLVFLSSSLQLVNLNPPLTKFQQRPGASSLRRKVWCETQCWHCSQTWSRRCCTRHPAPPTAPLESTWMVGDSGGQLGNTRNVASETYREERRDEPAVAVGEGEDVVLVVLQTGHATCSGRGH